MTATNEVHELAAERPETIIVSVNNRPVTFHVKRATGAEVKGTAIAQGVPVELPCVLFEVHDGDELNQIDDTETVKLHRGQKFKCIMPDDDSGEGV